MQLGWAPDPLMVGRGREADGGQSDEVQVPSTVNLREHEDEGYTSIASSRATSEVPGEPGDAGTPAGGAVAPAAGTLPHIPETAE